MKSTHALFCLACCFTLCTASVSAAHAAGPPLALSTGERAADLYKRATDFYREKKLTEAEALYREAWALQQSYDVATNLGAVALDLKKYRDAAEYLSFATRTFPARGNQDEREAITVRLQLAKAEVVTLRVHVNVDKADVSLNGKRAGVAPIAEEVFAEAGAITVEAVLAGYDTATQTLEGKKGEARDVELKLSPKATGPRTGTGPRKEILIGGAAGSGAMLVLGAVLAGVATSKAGDVAAARQTLTEQNTADACVSGKFVVECKALDDAKRAHDGLSNGAFWVLIGAGALGAGTAIYYFAAKEKPTTAPLTAGALVVDHGGGLVIRGAW